MIKSSESAADHCAVDDFFTEVTDMFVVDLIYVQALANLLASGAEIPLAGSCLFSFPGFAIKFCHTREVQNVMESKILYSCGLANKKKVLQFTNHIQ